MVDFTNYLNDYLSTNITQNNKRSRMSSYVYDYEENHSTTSEILYFSINDSKSYKRPRIHSYDYDYEEIYPTSSETSNSSNNSETYNPSSKRVTFDRSIKNYDGLREDLFIFLKICKNESVKVTDKNMIKSLLILTKNLIQRIKEAIENNNSRVYILNGGGSNTYILKSNFDIKINELLEFETVLERILNVDL